MGGDTVEDELQHVEEGPEIENVGDHKLDQGFINFL